MKLFDSSWNLRREIHLNQWKTRITNAIRTVFLLPFLFLFFLLSISLHPSLSLSAPPFFHIRLSLSPSFSFPPSPKKNATFHFLVHMRNLWWPLTHKLFIIKTPSGFYIYLPPGRAELEPAWVRHPLQNQSTVSLCAQCYVYKRDHSGTYMDRGYKSKNWGIDLWE